MSTESINTVEEQGESAEHAQAMIEKGEQLIQNNNPDTPERPDWLPEKFKTVEQMAEAYSQLEKKMGSGGQEEQESVEDLEDVSDMPSVDTVQQAVTDAGVDYDSLQNEYNELGNLSEDTFKRLEEAGFPKDLVSSWIAGQESISNNYQSAVYETVGGEESYQEMLSWAADNLSEAEIAAYDKSIDSGDIELVKLAVAGIKTKYQAVEGEDPQLVSGQSTNSSGGNYGSWAEVTAAMRDSRYDSDPAYRQQVVSKLGRSQL